MSMSRKRQCWLPGMWMRLGELGSGGVHFFFLEHIHLMRSSCFVMRELCIIARKCVSGVVLFCTEMCA